MENKKFEFIIYYLHRDGCKEWIDIHIFAKNVDEAFTKAKEHRRWIYEVELISIDNQKLKKPISWKQRQLEQLTSD